ncbi:hypothetical protein SAMN05192529_12038 [Arachidicoccus rhizosphaerae]|jgi:hypothetical protein|uniref:Uncharacterized protein n=1 Tax=Arachidicoccus rhizosphaerae TaxID=551991 RepID=A0A1H4BEE3_9BACT|nr:hypothetical protein [Arachidicoccus rhizosphaerae]SEA46414.1 hypothetical protein SAMN05192529_12038 [Arachidicoccus rhizosphaerae]
MEQPRTEKNIEESVEILYGRGNIQQRVSEGMLKRWWTLWGYPLIMFVLIMVGLIGALVEDGWWDLFFCLLLIFPLYKICHHYYGTQNNKKGDRIN